jgi:hypothetical protein
VKNICTTTRVIISKLASGTSRNVVDKAAIDDQQQRQQQVLENVGIIRTIRMRTVEILNFIFDMRRDYRIQLAMAAFKEYRSGGDAAVAADGTLPSHTVMIDVQVSGQNGQVGG